MADIVGGVATQNGQNIGTWIFTGDAWALVPNDPTSTAPYLDATGIQIAQEIVAQTGLSGLTALNQAAQAATAANPNGGAGVLDLTGLLTQANQSQGNKATPQQIAQAANTLKTAVATVAPGAVRGGLTISKPLLFAAAGGLLAGLAISLLGRRPRLA